MAKVITEHYRVVAGKTWVSNHLDRRDAITSALEYAARTGDILTSVNRVTVIYRPDDCDMDTWDIILWGSNSVGAVVTEDFYVLSRQARTENYDRYHPVNGWSLPEDIDHNQEAYEPLF